MNQLPNIMPQPQRRTVHLICHSGRPAMQTYRAGMDDQGEGGRAYRAAEGTHLYIRDDDAQELMNTSTFEFIAYESDPKDVIPSRPGLKTIEQIYAEQQQSQQAQQNVPQSDPWNVPMPPQTVSQELRIAEFVEPEPEPEPQQNTPQQERENTDAEDERIARVIAKMKRFRGI